MTKKQATARREAREALQAKLNREAMELYPVVKDEVRLYCNNVCRLRTCRAIVYDTSKFIVLESYNTIVAFIDKRTNIMYDVLRVVYGYTATSAQHIAKFRHDYYSIECILAK